MILQIFIIFQKFVSCIQEKKFMIGVFPRYIGAGNFVHAIWCLNSFSIHYCISQLWRLLYYHIQKCFRDRFYSSTGYFTVPEQLTGQFHELSLENFEIFEAAFNER